MDTHCPFDLRPIRPCTNWSFVQLDHLLIGHVHSPPKINWTGLAHGQPAQLTPLTRMHMVYNFQRTENKPHQQRSLIIEVSCSVFFKLVCFYQYPSFPLALYVLSDPVKFNSCLCIHILHSL